MASNNDWETVGSKKGSKNIKVTNKDQQQNASRKQRPNNNLDNMPRIEPNAPMKESPTIYQAFLEEELRKERKLLESEKENANKEAKKPSATTMKRRDRALSLKDCLTKLQIEEFESILKKDEILYPKNSNIWLRDIASFLNSQLDHITDFDPIIANKPNVLSIHSDYPVSEMPDTLKKYLIEKFSSFSSEANLSLLDYCIESLTTNAIKDQSSYGFRLIVQILLHSRPNLVLDHLTKFESLLQRNSNRPIKALAILWSVGQVGVTSLNNGVKVWFGVMFSLVNVRNLNSYVLQYLETLFTSHGFDLSDTTTTKSEKSPTTTTKLSSSSACYDCVSKTDYFKYLGELYSESSMLSKDLKTRLKCLYPAIKKLAWGDASKTLNSFFTGYLTRYTNDCADSKKKELLDCLIECLRLDAQSFAAWRKEYKKNISQSRLLLQYISEHESELKLKKRELSQTVDYFQIANDELMQKVPRTASQSTTSTTAAATTAAASSVSSANQKELEINVQLCNSLSQKHKKSSASRCTRLMMSLFVIICLSVIILLSFDVYHHGSTMESLTYKKLSEAGVINAIDYLYKNARDHLQVALKWISDNVPQHLERALELVTPYVQLLLKKIALAFDYAMDKTTNQRLWMVEMFHYAHNQLIIYTPGLFQCLEWVCEHAINMASLMFDNICRLVESIYKYLSNDVFVGQLSPQNVKNSLLELLKLAQNSIQSVIVWVQETAYKK
ncbi:hypothetical protein HELRODRAFT_194215 [Helobdella robusta]|uniref:Transmembrane protein 214 n=1 Tax=Helobdella robusta TaxID=6412 RepID=T1FVT5_HELRO|nr:hypothetical protein HELRODRAFT_194215 [Helobdella robusta]ESN92497.1 hypothetical protein HELRODRAFT_194215 [Helobdella robusta]